MASKHSVSCDVQQKIQPVIHTFLFRDYVQQDHVYRVANIFQSFTICQKILCGKFYASVFESCLTKMIDVCLKNLSYNNKRQPHFLSVKLQYLKLQQQPQSATEQHPSTLNRKLSAFNYMQCLAEISNNFSASQQHMGAFLEYRLTWSSAVKRRSRRQRLVEKTIFTLYNSYGHIWFFQMLPTTRRNGENKTKLPPLR